MGIRSIFSSSARNVLSGKCLYTNFIWIYELILKYTTLYILQFAFSYWYIRIVQSSVLVIPIYIRQSCVHCCCVAVLLCFIDFIICFFSRSLWRTSYIRYPLKYIVRLAMRRAIGMFFVSCASFGWRPREIFIDCSIQFSVLHFVALWLSSVWFYKRAMCMFTVQCTVCSIV